MYLAKAVKSASTANFFTSLTLAFESTAAALSVFTDKDLEKIVLDAMTAAKKRAQELA